MQMRSILGLVFFLLSVITYSQDLIITNTHDTISCKITKEKNDFIYFMYQRQDSSYLSTLVKKNDIIFYEKNYYKNNGIVKKTVPIYVLPGFKDFTQFKIGIHGGLGWLTAKLSDDIPEELVPYNKQLKSGFNYGANAAWFFSKHYGIGVGASIFRSKNAFSGYILYEDEDGNTQYGRISDDIKLSYIGSSFYYRFLMPNLNDELSFDISIGYLTYNIEKTYVDDFIIKSNTFSFDLGAGYDFNIQENFYLYLYVALRGGLFGWFDIDDGNSVEKITLEDNFESTSRIEVSIGIRIAK